MSYTVHQERVIRIAREYDEMMGFIDESYFERLKGRMN